MKKKTAFRNDVCHPIIFTSFAFTYYPEYLLGSHANCGIQN